MTDRREHEAIEELLGAYALDALEPDDRAAVERYLDGSAAARAEVDLLRETATMLALAPGPSEPAPPQLWERINAEIDEDAPVVVTPVDITTRRRTVPWRVAGPVAAAAAAVIGLLAFQVVDLRGQVDDAEREVASAQAAYEQVRTRPEAREVTLASGDGAAAAARVVVLPDGTGYLVGESLEPLGPDETYQLWALVGDADAPTAISAGVLGPDPQAAAFRVSGPVVGFALTEEAAGGVVSSDQDPVALGLLEA
jgi:anti-sigma-K factor RskA